MLLSKNLLFMTLCRQRNMYDSMLGKFPLLVIALCTLSSNISAPTKKFFLQYPGCWDTVSLMLFCKALLSMTLGYLKKMFKNTLGEMGLFTLSSNILAPGVLDKNLKKMPRMLGYIVLDDPLQNSSFHDTCFSKKNQ